MVFLEYFSNYFLEYFLIVLLNSYYENLTTEWEVWQNRQVYELHL